MTEFLSSFVSAISIPLLFWWLAQRYPAPQLSSNGPTLEELSPKYRKWEIWPSVLGMALVIPVSAVIYAPLHFFSLWRAHSMQVDPVAFVFYADGAALVIPAFFLAIVLSSHISMPIFRCLLKNRYSEFERYQALKFGFDQNRISRGFGLTISITFVLVVMGMFDVYVVATSESIRVNPFLGFERRYAYSDVAEIVTAPAFIARNGNTVYRREYLLKFKDGTVFSSDFIEVDEILNRSYQELIGEIAKRSGVMTQEKEFFQDGDL